MTITTPKLDEALGLIAEVVTEPVFKVEELERQRTLAIDTLKVAYANPGTLASLVATRMLFGAGAYGNPSGGTPASLARIDRDDLLALYRARYRPDNAVLILVGDVDLARATTLASRRFGRWSRPNGAVAGPTGDRRQSERADDDGRRHGRDGTGRRRSSRFRCPPSIAANGRPARSRTWCSAAVSRRG